MTTTNSKSVIVCDKEPLSRARITRIVTELGHKVVAQVSNAADAITATTEHRPDVILLDLRMPSVDGSQCAQELAKIDSNILIIFTTNFDHFAINFFQENSIAYAVKPANKEQLAVQINSVKPLAAQQLKDVLTLENNDYRPQRKHLTARDRKGAVIIDINDIYCFTADQKYVDIHHKDGIIPTTETLKDLEIEFADLFLRVHRNTIVNVNHVDGIDAVGGGQHRIRLKDAECKITVSRRLLPEVRQKLQAV